MTNAPLVVCTTACCGGAGLCNNIARRESSTVMINNHPMSDINARGYAHPEALVSTDWVAEHLHDPNVRIIESNEDMLLYPANHIPGAVQVDWTQDLNDPIQRDYISAKAFT